MIKATSSGVVHHADSGTYPHFWCDMTYDVRGCTVIGASMYNKQEKIPYDSWIPAIYVTNHSGKASIRVTVLADEKTRLGVFTFFPETGAQIVCDRSVPIIRAEPGTTNACDWAHGVTHYGVAWYYADKNSPAQEPVYKNDGMYYYSEVKPVSLKGSTYDVIFGTKIADYDFTVPHTSFVVMDNGKATPEWEGGDFYGATNEYYGTTKKFQIAYRAHRTTGIYTTDSGYYFPDGTTSRTVSINTAQDGYVNDTNTVKTFSTCYIPAEQVAETPVALIPVASLDVPNATCTIEGTKVAGKEDLVLSNGTYTVTYKATGDYCLTGGKTELTYDLDTTVNPATLKGGEKPPEAYIPVAKIDGGIGYATLQEALDAAKDGDTVRLCQDSTEAVTVSKSLMLDLGTHTLVAAEGTTVTVDSGKTLTLAGETGATIGKAEGEVTSESKDITVDGDQGWAGTKAPYTIKDYIEVDTNTLAAAHTTWELKVDGQTVTADEQGKYRVFKGWGATVTYKTEEGYCFENTATEETKTLNTTGDEGEKAKLDDDQKPGDAIYAIATTGGTAYESAQAAFDAAESGAVVTLVNDTTETVTLAADKTVNLALNDHTLGKLEVTEGTVNLPKGTSGTITSVHVVLPGKIVSEDEPMVAAPEGYEWFNGNDGYTLVKTTEPYTGDVTINEDITHDETWVMALSNANITVEKVAGTDTLASITNNLTAITGTGKILLNAVDKDYRDYLRSLRTAESEATLTIDCLTVEPKDDGQGGLEAVVDAAAEDPEAETTLVGAMKTDGDVLIEVKEDATKDVVVNEGAETSKDMTIINESEKALTVPEAKAENVTIRNYGHLESDTTANNNLNIFNGSANTLVGTYAAGGAINVTGAYGSLSNVVLDATGKLTFTGKNIITGPVTLTYDSIDVDDNTLLFSVENNNTTLDIDFAPLAGSKAFGVIIDDAMASGTYPLATDAAQADDKTFALMNAAYTKIADMTANATNNPVYNGGKYALTNDVDGLKLTVDANYVSNKLEEVTAMAKDTEATVAGMRLLQADKDLANEQIWKYYYNDTTGKVCTAQNTAKVDESVDDFVKNLADLLEYAKENYEDMMPTDVTIDATIENPDGTNTFKTLDAAFKAETTSCATNLVLTDRFTTLSGNVPVDKTPDPATNSLQVITGSGYLLIDENHKNTAGEWDGMALAAALQALVAEDSTVKVRTAAQTVNEGDMVLSEDLAAFESITLTDPSIAGDVELIAPTSTITGTLAWDVSKDVALLHDFDSISNEVTKYAIDVGSVSPSTGVATKTLATGAGTLSDKTFSFTTSGSDYASLTVGVASNVVYNGMVYTLAMNGTDLELTMDGDYVPAQLAVVLDAYTNAVDTIKAMRLTPSEKETVIADLTRIYDTATNGVDLAKNKTEVEAAVAPVAGDIATVLKAAVELESTKPGDITVDATIEQPDGTNTFNTLDAAFSNKDFMPCATNLVISGNVGLSAGVLAYPATNCLTMISGVGTVVIDKDHKDAAGNNDVEALTEFFNSIAGAGVTVTTAAANVPVTGELSTETNVVAASSITLGGTTTIKAGVTLTAPKVTNNGTLNWDLTGDNHDATLQDFDSIVEGAGAKYQLTLDAAQTNTIDGIITNYTIATGAASATNLTFTLKGFSPEKELKVGEENTLYLDAKAFKLVVDEENNLVFKIEWGKFSITYDAAGGTWTDGTATTNIDAYVNKGYEFPAAKPMRIGYTFNGWYRSWTNNAEKVSELDLTASEVLPLEAHKLYAQWTRTAATDSRFSDMLGENDPRVAITTNDNFRGNLTLTTLNMPLYVTKIGTQAFRGASNLKTINFVQPHAYADFSELPLEIEDYAFMGCALEEVVIPAYVTKIGKRAFSGCNHLKKITLLGTPSGMTVGGQPFNLCGTKAANGLTISLAPAAATNTQFVADLTNGCTSVIKLAQQLDGELSLSDFSTSYSSETDEVTMTITYTGSGIVNTRSVSALYGLTTEELVKNPKYLKPVSVTPTAKAGEYTCVFKTGNVGAKNGSFRPCIGESF